MTYIRTSQKATETAKTVTIAFMRGAFVTLRAACLLWSMLVIVGTAAAQTEPELASTNIPKYPAVAVTARVQGTVKLTFTLPANGAAPTNIKIVSGIPLLNSTALENVKSWRFGNPGAEHTYETTFEFRFSGKTIPASETPKTTVTLESFHRVEIVTDLFEQKSNPNY